MRTNDNYNRIALLNGSMFNMIGQVVNILDNWVETDGVINNDILKKEMGVLITLVGMAGHIRLYNEERDNWIANKGSAAFTTTDAATMLAIKQFLLRFKYRVVARYN